MTRNAHDFYPTPPALAAATLKHLDLPELSTILDPGAGSGVWGQAARAFFPDAHIRGVELRETPKPDGYNDWSVGDYLLMNDLSRPDLVIGNPPFSLAQQFVEHSYNTACLGGYIVFLLRLAFLETQKRQSFWRRYPPDQVLVLPRRPSFTGNGNTDSTAYAIYVWRTHLSPRMVATRLSWLEW